VILAFPLLFLRRRSYRRACSLTSLISLCMCMSTEQNRLLSGEQKGLLLILLPPPIASPLGFIYSSTGSPLKTRFLHIFRLIPRLFVNLQTDVISTDPFDSKRPRSPHTFQNGTTAGIISEHFGLFSKWFKQTC
jgi:hypothetical protein